MSWGWLRRILSIVVPAVLLIFSVVVVMFFLLELAPGDPIQALVGDAPVPEEFRRQVVAAYGLDRPLGERFLAYIANIVTGNLGYSFANGTPVLDLIVGRLGNTLILTIPSLIISSIGGILLGSAAARTRNPLLDRTISFISVAGFSIPGFWLALMLVMFFSINLGILPAQGMAPFGNEGIDLRNLILPVASLAVAELAFKARIMRATMIEVLGQDYIDTARSKGLTGVQILRGHALKNSMLPMISVVGYSAGYTIAGAVTIEKVFSWPGMGLLLFTSIQKGENMVVMGILLIMAITIVVVNLITDVIYALVDPRIRARLARARA